MVANKVGILGAGLAGLSAAIHLSGAGCEVFEREDRPGGLCRSRHVRGYVFDYGPHVFYTKSAFVKTFVSSLLKKGGNRLVGKPRRAYIYLDGIYVKYPFEANLYPLPEKIKRECIVGAKNRKPSRGKSFSNWILSTFGKGIARHYMAPYNSKIWKYPLEMMGTDWIAGRVPAPSLRDIIAGANESGKKEFGGNRYFHYPLFGGTGAIPAALALGLEGAISCGSEVTVIKKRKQDLEVAFVRRDGARARLPLSVGEGLSRQAKRSLGEGLRALGEWGSPPHSLESKTGGCGVGSGAPRGIIKALNGHLIAFHLQEHM